MLGRLLTGKGKYGICFNQRLPALYSADEGCQWITPEAEGLEMNPAYILPPQRERDRDTWLASLKAYRIAIREGATNPAISLAFDGVRAWIRRGEVSRASSSPTIPAHPF